MAHSSHTKSSISIDLFNIPSLPDERRQATMFFKIQNDFFLPEGKNSRLSQIVNTWTFGRLTPNGNEGVSVKITCLECTYGTRYYMVDQVNGQLSTIHDGTIQLTEFAGHFSPFNLDELELKICKLAAVYDQEDMPSQPNKPCQGHDSGSSSEQQNIEDLTDMGFSSLNYSPIPMFGNTVSEQSAGMRSSTSVPTLTPRPEVGSHLNTLYPTHNRGKTQVNNDWTHIQDSQELQKKMSKGGKVKSSQNVQSMSQPQSSTSTGNMGRPKVNIFKCI